MKKEDIYNLLLWYEENKRDLPWRHTKDPYKIWISEIMLQQTRVEFVKRYYERFLNTLPTLKDLSEVSEEVLLKLWQGLGFYSRARNLQKCAKILIERGENTLPDSKEELMKLPGIGDYTSGAILSIAYLKPYPAIDGNVIRVLSRVYMDSRDFLKPEIKEEYSKLLKELMLDFSSDNFTQSFIELGALICLPNGTPKCFLCPLKKCCMSYKNKVQEQYPFKKEKKKRTILLKTILIYTYKEKYAILKRDKKGLLASMYEFPNIDEELNLKELKNYLKEHSISYSKIESFGTKKHIFSHLEWHMKIYKIELSKEIKPYLFATKKELQDNYSLPTAFSKLLKKISKKSQKF